MRVTEYNSGEADLAGAARKTSAPMHRNFFIVVFISVKFFISHHFLDRFLNIGYSSGCICC